MRRSRIAPCILLLLVLAGCTADRGAAPPTDSSAEVPSGPTAGPSSAPDPSATAAAEAGPLRLTMPRAVHRATRLLDGRELITGGCTRPGCGGFDAGRASELFEPVRRQFRTGPQMHSARAGGTATRRPDGGCC